MSGRASSRPGFCGKLPARADFVTRRLPIACVETWNSWLAEALQSSREALGEAWLDTFLNGPIWRFAVPGGIAGSGATRGTIMPSVDKVGRYFPFTIMETLTPGFDPVRSILQGSAWFEAAEAVSLRALEDGIDLDHVDAAVDALTSDDPDIASPPSPGATDSTPPPGLFLAIDPQADLAASPRSAALMGGHMRAGRNLWWTRGSARLNAVMVITQGLPQPGAFAAFLDGDWIRHGWHPAYLEKEGEG